jgi:hypothetical protein
MARCHRRSPLSVFLYWLGYSWSISNSSGRWNVQPWRGSLAIEQREERCSPCTITAAHQYAARFFYHVEHEEHVDFLCQGKSRCLRLCDAGVPKRHVWNCHLWAKSKDLFEKESSEWNGFDWRYWINRSLRYAMLRSSPHRSGRDDNFLLFLSSFFTCQRPTHPFGGDGQSLFLFVAGLPLCSLSFGVSISEAGSPGSGPGWHSSATLRGAFLGPPYIDTVLRVLFEMVKWRPGSKLISAF